MNSSLYGAAAALDGNIKWQQMIAENLAAGSTPAFKKSEISFSNVVAGVLGAGSENAAVQRDPSVLPKPSFATNFIQGSLEGTGSSTDLALDGKGFLAVRLPDGRIYYTRDGTFRVNLQGEIRNKDGYEIISEEGNPIIVNPRNKEFISVSPAGEVSEGGLIRGKLSLFEFADITQLSSIGNGYFFPKPGTPPPVAALDTTVHQSQLEASNTLPMAEVSNLLLALRHYEANQRVIQMHDERMGRAVQELSSTT
ncbi:MAG: flagellar hook-basal body protein [Verrucomicrobia bacterium]|nr:flagellar hook-basal body protein [Verrucomicrobiota bacterium]